MKPCSSWFDRCGLWCGGSLRRIPISGVSCGARFRAFLYTAEGYYSRGRNRQARYHNALGSAGESLACLHVAEALEYIEPVDAELSDRFDKVLATLTKLARER